jgi:hypothetical protein
MNGNVFGKIRSGLEDLAFLKRPQGKPSSRSKCLRKLKPVDSENTPLLPQRVNSGSDSGFALLTSSVRNHARSAFKRFSHPLPFAYPPQRGKEMTGAQNLKGARAFPKKFPFVFIHTAIWQLWLPAFVFRPFSV